MPTGFRRTTDRKGRSEAAPPPHGIFPAAEAPRARRPYGFKDGQVGLEGRIYTPAGLFSQVLPATVHDGGNEDGVGVEHVVLGDGVEENDEMPDANMEARDEKKKRQWRKWSEDIIPALLKPYLKLLEETSGLRHMENVRNKGCKGCNNVRQLEVSCIFFERKYDGLFIC